jgi:hypothetical protein
VRGDSHPHLVHEFVRSIVEGRPPAIGAVTAAGICAHESAMQGGRVVEVPGLAPPVHSGRAGFAGRPGE